MKKISVLLVDDHAIVRAGFRMLLSAEPMLDIVAEADRGESACQLYSEKSPDVVVLDLSMPGIGGLACIRRICVRDANARILVFSVHDEAVFVNRALEAGALGYITKSSASEILVEAIQTIAGGKTYVESALVNRTSAKIAPYPEPSQKNLVNLLSPKEFDVFCLLAKGLTTQKIAEELCLSYKTVANYGTLIKTKLQVSTTAELAHLATALGIYKP